MLYIFSPLITMIDLESAQILLKGANSKNGLGYLEWYASHKVYHPGIDLNKGYGDQDLGMAITAPEDGIVEFVSPNAKNGGFGLHCVIYHAQKNVWTHYVHLATCEVKASDRVNKHQKIATLGKSGTTFAHLHFEVWSQELREKYQKNRGGWKKDYEFYPTNFTKNEVAQLYPDPNEFLRVCLKGVPPLPDWLMTNEYPPPPKDLKPKWDKKTLEELEKAIEWNDSLKTKIITKLETEQHFREVLMFYRYNLIK